MAMLNNQRVVDLPCGIFTYTWLIFGVNVGNFLNIPYMEHMGHYKCAIVNSYVKLPKDTHLKSSAILGWFPDFEASFQASGERREVVFFLPRKDGFEHPMKNLDVLKGTPKKTHIPYRFPSAVDFPSEH